MESAGARKATFTAMENSTQADWQAIGAHYVEFARGLPGRVLAHLGVLAGDSCGFPIDRLTHSLLTATLAHKGGEDEEYVVCALVHDIGDTLGPWNHPDIAAAILRPYVSEANAWMVEKHAILQGYHFFHHIGLDRNLRDQLRDSPHYERTERFVELYDNPAFDPALECLPLDFFAPMVERVLAAPRRSLYQGAAQPQAGSR
jgi:predicted HD phosphohydrolase